MHFQQSSQCQLSFECSNIDSLTLKENSSLSLTGSSVCAGPLSLNYNPILLSSKAKSSHRNSIHVSDNIIAPAPKKPHHCTEGGMYKYGSRSLSPWGLSTLNEDSDEDFCEVNSKTKFPAWNAENDAYAELLQIVQKNGSQEGSESHSSPIINYNIPQTEVQPMTIMKKGIELEENLDDIFSTDSNYSAHILGRSPICRTQNPLPLDMMFSPKTASPGISRDNQQSELVIISNSGDAGFKTTGGLVHACNLTRPLPLSFHKLNLRPRSLSVGSRSGKVGITF